MTQQRLVLAGGLERWLSGASRMNLPTVITCDFDGTLTPRFVSDEDHFNHTAGPGREAITGFLQGTELIGGVCTSRSILEVKRILDLGFVDQNSRDLGGLSAAENGAVVFCRKLSSGLEAQLKARGFQIDTRFGDLTSINLAKVTPEELREKVVMPAVRASGVADEVWSSSVGENHQAINFQRLMQMSRHESAQRTHDACQRFGTAYVKVNDTQDGKGQSLVRNLGDYAAAAGVLCLVTPPLENHPIWTVDLGAGVTKSDAMRSISEVYSVLTGLSESKIRFLYFGDGENDLPAFEYMSTRAGEHNFAFLLDNPHGNNDERAMRVAPGTRYLRGYYDLAGVRFGIKQVCGI